MGLSYWTYKYWSFINFKWLLLISYFTIFGILISNNNNNHMINETYNLQTIIYISHWMIFFNRWKIGICHTHRKRVAFNSFVDMWASLEICSILCELGTFAYLSFGMSWNSILPFVVIIPPSSWSLPWIKSFEVEISSSCTGFCLSLAHALVHLGNEAISSCTIVVTSAIQI